MSDEPAPAGWYPDPTGRAALRWWDGTNWTAHAEAAKDASAAQPAARPAGWYVDPTDESARRWWDGSSWTQETQADPTPSVLTDRRTLVGALIAVTALLLLAGGAVTAMWLGDDEVAASDETSAAEDASDEDGSGSRELENSEDPESSDDATDAQARDGADGDWADGERITVDFDDVCRVEVDRDRAEAGNLRPWDAGCASAPIQLERGESRWIVVVSSLNGVDFDQAAAIERSQDRGLSSEVLWSSHYPSLNPGLWVVFDGPFIDEQAANATAAARDDGSYARVVSDDNDDRYCNAADGCRGERGSY